MFKIDSSSNQISVTRGDIIGLNVTANLDDDSSYIFKQDEIIRFKVFARKNCEEVVLQKDFLVLEETNEVGISLTSEDTKIGDYINKPVKYWYEVELNPDTAPQTIIGYDEDGEKIFMLYPEGSVIE